MIVQKQDRTVDGTKVVILRVEGLIKLGESAEFFAAAINIALPNSNIVIDIENIDYLDSTGPGEFIGVCVNLVRHGRNIVVLQPTMTERVNRLIHVARAVDDLRVFRTEDEAVAAVIASAPASNVSPTQ